jgi:hypothetical protein
LIKIDRSFITRLDESITDTIITLGRNLALLVIAEGVETQVTIEHQHRNAWKLFGKHAIQLLAPPDRLHRSPRGIQPTTSAVIRPGTATVTHDAHSTPDSKSTSGERRNAPVRPGEPRPGHRWRACHIGAGR